MSGEARTLAEVIGSHAGIEGFFGCDLYRNYACACGWWCTARLATEIGYGLEGMARGFRSEVPVMALVREVLAAMLTRPGERS